MSDKAPPLRMLRTGSPARKSPWIKTSERYPTEQDGDCNGDIWMFPGPLSYNVCRAGWSTPQLFKWITHWMPTNLTRPEPPKETDRVPPTIEEMRKADRAQLQRDMCPDL